MHADLVKHSASLPWTFVNIQRFSRAAISTAIYILIGYWVCLWFCSCAIESIFPLSNFKTKHIFGTLMPQRKMTDHLGHRRRHNVFCYAYTEFHWHLFVDHCPIFLDQWYLLDCKHDTYQCVNTIFIRLYQSIKCWYTFRSKFIFIFTAAEGCLIPVVQFQN